MKLPLTNLAFLHSVLLQIILSHSPYSFHSTLSFSCFKQHTPAHLDNDYRKDVCYSLKIATIYNGGLIITSLLEWWHESLVSATTLQSSWFHFIKGNPTINILINEFCTSFLSSCNLFKALKSSDSMKKCRWLFFWKQIIFFGQLFDSTIWSVTSQSDFSLWGIIQLHLRSLQKGPP